MQVDAGMGVRNYVLVRARQRSDALEHMKFNILVKSTQLDRTNTEEVQKFNDLLREYDRLRNPEKVVENEKAAKDVRKEMEAAMNIGNIEVVLGDESASLIEENQNYTVKDLAKKATYAKGSFVGKKKPKNMEKIN